MSCVRAVFVLTAIVPHTMLVVSAFSARNISTTASKEPEPDWNLILI
jgi:hypothetical protein